LKTLKFDKNSDPLVLHIKLLGMVFIEYSLELRSKGPERRKLLLMKNGNNSPNYQRTVSLTNPENPHELLEKYDGRELYFQGAISCKSDKTRDFKILIELYQSFDLDITDTKPVASEIMNGQFENDDNQYLFSLRYMLEC